MLTFSMRVGVVAGYLVLATAAVSQFIDQSGLFDSGTPKASQTIKGGGKPPKTVTNYLLAGPGGGYLTTLSGEKLLAK